MKKFFSRSKAHQPFEDITDGQQDDKSTVAKANGKATTLTSEDVYEGRLEPLHFSDIPWDLDAQPLQQRQVPARIAGSSLPPDATMPAQSPVEERNSIYAVDQPEARASSSTLSHGHGPRMVVFAPSPEKQRSRPTPVTMSDQVQSTSYAISNGSNSSFARPTIASQARARVTGRASAGNSSVQTRSGSLAASARRSYSYNATPSHGESLSIPGRASDTRSGRLSLDLHGNTSIRSTSPLDYPRRTSAPMLATGSSSSGRRSSLLPPFSVSDSDDAVTFPVTGNAPRSFGFPTWSEMTQQDLVRNLGPRERTRQEVLWEIVASEERYVLELEKARELYIDALLHPNAFDPQKASAHDSPTQSKGSPGSRQNANASGSETLPIAARYMAHSEESSPSLGHDNDKETASPAMPSRTGPQYGLGLGLGTTAARERSTATYANASAPSLPTKPRRSRPRISPDADALRLSVPLPPSLKEVLSAIADGLLEAHETLCDALKARYEAQWPLVRSLADVFMQHSHMLAHYATYVCHLQRAMGELEEAALMERAFRGKKLRKERLSSTVGLGRTVAALEARAAGEQGCAGLSLLISMPFQRLLKYPLLFQNLLYHTDPSTHEFESTVAMVVEVERLVRSIEDEKVSVEQRDQTRDAFARIDGITNQQVLRPKSNRVLIEERPLYDGGDDDDVPAGRSLSDAGPSYASDSEGGGVSGTESVGATRGLRATLRSKRSYRRLTTMLEVSGTTAGKPRRAAVGGKKDVWVVRFSDMELQCRRIGVTALPIASTAALTGGGGPSTTGGAEAQDFAARSRESRLRLKALRSTTLRANTRNLYKFIAVSAWRTAPITRDADNAGEPLTGVDPTHEIAEEEKEESDERSSTYSSTSSSSSGRSSEVAERVRGGGLTVSDKYVRSTKLSFTYWGDRIEPNAAAAARRGSHDDEHPAPNRTAHPHQQQQQQRRGVSGGSHRATTNVRTTSSGMASRMEEPMTATSITTASASVQNVVAQMHARPRTDKFGTRLRPSLPPPSSTSIPLTPAQL